MDFSPQDGKKLSSLIWHKEELLNKKRSWLMESAKSSASEGIQKKSKRPKFLSDVIITHKDAIECVLCSSRYLRESHSRSDEVNLETMRTTVGKSFVSYYESLGKHHVVQDFLQLFDVQNMENTIMSPSNFIKAFSSIMDDLKTDALCAVADIVSNNNVSCERTRPRMKKVIKDYLPCAFTDLHCETSLKLLKQLEHIFRSPGNFQEKRLTLTTPVSQPLLSSIDETLGGLNEMPFEGLRAMNRKLKGIGAVPQFPPVRSSYNRKLFIERIRRRCKKIVSTLEEGVDLPKQLAKALSVMRLSLKEKSRCVKILTSEFFPFSPDIVCLQNDILRALWSLPQVKFDELKALQPLVDPKAKVPTKTFRTALRKHLMEYLFECDEINIPEELQRILAFINRSSRRRPQMFSNETREEELDSVLNVSSELKKVILDLLPEQSTDEECPIVSLEGSNFDVDSGSNDFNLSGSEYFLSPDCCEHQQSYGSGSNSEAEITGESTPASFASLTCGDIYPSQPAKVAINFAGNTIKKPKWEQDDNANAFWPGLEKSVKLNSLDALQRTGNWSGFTVQDACDETALAAHKLIGYMIDTFLEVEGRGVDGMARSYLRSGSSPPTDYIGLPNTLKEDVRDQILFQAVEELLPSLPKSCVDRVKEFFPTD